MLGDRKNYVMSVEYAMRREMAYREKLRAKQDASNTTSTNTSSNVHLQVFPPILGQASISIQNSTTLLSVGPTSNPNPSTFFGARAVQSLPQIPQYAGQITGPTPLVRTPFQGPHLRTGAHLQKRKKAHHQPPQPGDYMCNLCQVDCTSEYNLRMHLKGHKHKAMLRNAKGKKVVSGGTSQGSKGPKYCELCRIWCTDESSFKLHLNGRNHTLKLHAQSKS